MIETLPVSPLSAALGEVLVELRLLASRWPSEVERKTFERALFDVHRDVSAALARFASDGPGAAPTTLDERASAAVHEAFMSSLVLAIMIMRFTRRAERRASAPVPSTQGAASAAARLLDAFDPWVQRGDVALRRVMLDGEPMQLVASSVALPA